MSIWKPKVAHELGRRNGRWKGTELWGGKATAGLARRIMGEIVVWGKGPGEVCKAWAGAARRAPLSGGKGCGAFCSESLNGSVPKGERDGKSHARLWADTETRAGSRACISHPEPPPEEILRSLITARPQLCTRNQEPLCQGISFACCGNIRSSSSKGIFILVWLHYTQVWAPKSQHIRYRRKDKYI